MGCSATQSTPFVDLLINGEVCSVELLDLLPD